MFLPIFEVPTLLGKRCAKSLADNRFKVWEFLLDVLDIPLLRDLNNTDPGFELVVGRWVAERDGEPHQAIKNILNL